jgi:hypothetical protein
MDRQASSVSPSRGRRLLARRAAVRIAAFLTGRDSSRDRDDDDDDLPRPNATISGLFPLMRLVRPAVA